MTVAKENKSLLKPEYFDVFLEYQRYAGKRFEENPSLLCYSESHFENRKCILVGEKVMLYGNKAII